MFVAQQHSYKILTRLSSSLLSLATYCFLVALLYVFSTLCPSPYELSALQSNNHREKYQNNRRSSGGVPKTSDLSKAKPAIRSKNGNSSSASGFKKRIIPYESKKEEDNDNSFFNEGFDVHSNEGSYIEHALGQEVIGIAGKHMEI